MKRVLLAALAVAGIGMLAPAHAATSLTFILDQNGCSGSGGCGAGPYGTITIEQGTDQSTVKVTETLAPEVGFVNTGAGVALVFNIDGNPTIQVEDLSSDFQLAKPPIIASTF